LKADLQSRQQRTENVVIFVCDKAFGSCVGVSFHQALRGGVLAA